MMKHLRRTGAFVLVLLLVCSLIKTSTHTTVKMVNGEYSLNDFINNEVLAVYEDGSCEVLSYISQTELAEGLAELASEENIAFIQPNYSYVKTGETVNDTNFSEQWALYNDGSFEIVDMGNDLPVFDNPFGQPAAPGQWTDPWRNDNALPGNNGFPFRNNPIGQPAGQWTNPWSDHRNMLDGNPFSGWFGHSVSGKASAASSAVSGIDINMQEAWALYDGRSREVIVALIDTGVDTNHEDFNRDVFWVNQGEIPGNGIDDDGNGYVDDVNGWNFYSNNNVTMWEVRTTTAPTARAASRLPLITGRESLVLSATAR